MEGTVRYDHRRQEAGTWTTVRGRNWPRSGSMGQSMLTCQQAERSRRERCGTSRMAGFRARLRGASSFGAALCAALVSPAAPGATSCRHAPQGSGSGRLGMVPEDAARLHAPRPACVAIGARRGTSTPRRCSGHSPDQQREHRDGGRLPSVGSRVVARDSACDR